MKLMGYEDGASSATCQSSLPFAPASHSRAWAACSLVNLKPAPANSIVKPGSRHASASGIA